MSREEAVKELTELLPEEFLSEYTDAIKMAIETLEQEPCDDAVSRQAAINAAIEAADEWDGGGNRNREKVIAKALERLPSVTPQPCGDYISREETLKTLMDEWTEYDSELIGWLFEKIDKLPSVTPQPKVGRWGFTKHYGRDYYVCSVCGMERMDDHSSGWNYCPFCGCKMQGVEG